MNWKKYPQHLPEESDEYLVTLSNREVVISRFEGMTKHHDANGTKFYGPAWHDLRNGGLGLNVIAWAKKPLPHLDWRDSKEISQEIKDLAQRYMDNGYEVMSVTPDSIKLRPIVLSYEKEELK